MSTLALGALALLAGIATLVGTAPLAGRLARWGLIDRPQDRSLHQTVVPRGGGAALIGAVTAGVLAAATLGADPRVWVVVGLAAALGTVGLVDDRANLPFSPRAAAQLVVAAAVAAVALDTDLVLRTRSSGALVVALVLVWVLACCNAVNFMDGVDGITGVHVVIFGTYLAVIASGDDLVVVPAVVLVLAALGFLHANAIRRTVFLGDGGAYFVGCMLATLVVLAVMRDAPLWVTVAPFSIYLADTSTVIVKRAWARENLITAHQRHVYQRIVRLNGWTHRASTTFTATASTLCGLMALAVWRGYVPMALGVTVFVVVLGAYLTAPRWVPTSRPSVDGP